MRLSAERPHYVPPGWFAVGGPERLSVLDCCSGDTIELEGSLCEALLRGERPRALFAMARYEATVARFLEALGADVLRPLTRASLLRGTGYSQLFVELTARCNERCVHCYADSSPERHEALDAALLRNVLCDAAQLGFELVQLTGGDPLVSELCVPAVEQAARLGIPRVEIYTNGLLLTSSLLRAVAEHPVSFAFSFYSHEAAAHDAITRTRGSQRRTLDAIDRVLRAGLPVRVNVIVMEPNRGHLEATIALLVERGVARDKIGVDVQRSVGRGLMTIRPKEVRTAQALGGHKDEQPFGFGGRAAVASDGTVYPCIFSRSLPLGHLADRGLRAILEEERSLEVDLASLLAEYNAGESRLACWDCRLRGALLSRQ